MKNNELLQEMIRQGYIQVQKHPEHDLFIYNYTPKAQYDRIWNEATLVCRGLILDADRNVVARPFPKFFNLGEVEDQALPNEPFEVYEKMDGSLGVLYWANGEPHMATRGSFASEQAIRANGLLRTKYASALGKLSPGKTYLFEIIYPENRIVVNYGDREELVLLAIIDNATGEDLPLEDIGFPTAKLYHGIKDIHTLKTLQEDNREGFVIKFKGGARYKVKFGEYLRIHRIVTQISSIDLWEYLRAGMPFDEILDRVPDEFYQWVKSTKNDLEEKYRAIEAEAKAEFRVLETRKETALYFLSCKHPSVLFQMLDGRNHADAIWKKLRPAFSKPFANETEA